MTVTAVFDGTRDMELFARWVSGCGGSQAPAPVQPPIQQPAPTAPPIQQPAPVLQQAPTAPPVQAPVLQQAPVQPPIQLVPTSTVSYTSDDLARAAAPLMAAGKQAELIGLLQTFGVDSLPSLTPEQYGAFATALRGLGAQI